MSHSLTTVEAMTAESTIQAKAPGNAFGKGTAVNEWGMLGDHLPPLKLTAA